MTASSEIQLKKPRKPTQSAHQKTFQRLTKRIQALENDHKKLQRELDECLKFYQARIHPLKNEVRSAIKEFILILHEHYKGLKALNRKERQILKSLIESKLSCIYRPSPHTNPDPELTAVYKDLMGSSYEEAISDELEEMKEKMQRQFREQAGVDVDLSTITAEDSEAEMMKKLFEALHAAQCNTEEEEFVAKPKNKKEQKIEELQLQQKREISQVYKQLAKVLHPDLEQDPAEKAKKLELMKQLTIAYDKNDLHALLLLEMQWINRSKDAVKAQSEEQLKVYNSLLKEQVATLEEELQQQLYHPRYQVIHPYISDFAFDGVDSMNFECIDLQTELASYENVIKSLKSHKPEKIVPELIQEWYYANG